MADESKPKKSVSVGDIMGGKKDSKSSKKKHKHTHIEHHDDGSHTVRHTPVGGGEETSYAASDLDGVHDGLEQHVGEPNDGEGQEAQAEPEPQPAAPQQPMPGQGA